VTSNPAPGAAGRPCLEARRDFTRFDLSTDADPASPWLRWAIYLTHQLGEAHG
jgi:hypothetical protein